jgi:hypothetical protein
MLPGQVKPPSTSNAQRHGRRDQQQERDTARFNLSIQDRI